MISSLFFVLFVTVVVIISMAIPTLHLERTESAAAGTGGRPRTRLVWNQVNISPYRGVWMSSWILFLILCYTGGKALLPPLDLDIKLFQTSATTASTPTPNQNRDNRPTETASADSTPAQETESSVLPIPESEEETETPPEDSASVSTETEEREDMDEYRGRIPDWAARDEEDPIL